VTTDTTIPDGGPTAEPTLQAPCWALVLLWSAVEPNRMGEVAFIPTFEHRIVGRGDDKDDEIEKFAYFGQQRPGEPVVSRGAPVGLLKGPAISRRQLRVRSTPTALEMDVSGKCATFVNDRPTTGADLQEGDTIRLRGQALFLCVRRPKILIGPRARHTFGEPDEHGMTGEGPAIWALRAALLEVGALDVATLLRGESGTGKELAAAALHKASPRANKPFVSQNAANFTPSLLSSELFGNAADYPNHGAPARPGLFGLADRGTLFFDEVGDLALEAQAAVLRVLDDAGEFRSLGTGPARRVNVRFVGATNKDDSCFRSDFRARLRRTIELPSLRERREDIPLLVRHLLRLHAQKFPAFAERFVDVGPEGELEPRVDVHLIDYLVHQPLTSNMRELDQILQVAISKSGEGDGNVVTLPKSMRAGDTTPPPTSRDTEPSSAPPVVKKEVTDPTMPTRDELVARLAEAGGSVSGAAKIFNVHRNVVYRWKEKLGVK
jgi:DNA-binding NtrC family response regulator